MIGDHSSQSDTLSRLDLTRIQNQFADSDNELDNENIEPVSYESIMTCSRCGGTFQTIDEMMICNNEKCRMISDQSTEDITILKNSIPTTKTISIEQRNQIYKELKIMNKIADQIGVLPLPDEIIHSTVDLFAQLKNCRPETRNKKRRQLQGSCIYLRCIAHGLMRTRKDIQRLCGLTDRNLTTTIGEIEMEINKGNIILNGVYDIRASNTNSICIKLKIPESIIPNIIEDVKYIHDILSENMLISSNFDSKILAAIFISISYYGYEVNLKYICKISAINSETVYNIINICTDNMELFTRFSDRCEDIEKELKGDNPYAYISQNQIVNHIISNKK